jgi:CheY-like chemotaxis protein
MARSVVVKGVESPERLLDETALFLHRVVTELPAEKQRMLERLYSSDEDLVGRTVLLVDDDARNIFTLSSVLERRGMKVLTATTGREAIQTLETSDEVALVLMDIMMPEMDGYQTMQAIRSKPEFRRLPIIALTAKAMKGDREKCLEAGASDYLAKPVNILLVDDQPAKLLSYEAILTELGENLIKAHSGREALEILLKQDVALVLIDVVMPDLDGFELARMIRDHPRFARTALMFVSAVSVTELDLLKGYEHGAVDYMPVPIVPDLLRARVRIFLDLHRKTRALEGMNAELERRVEERTAALAEINQQLEKRVEERTREREVAMAQVHEMQKMESLGQLTGGLAHDFNNLLMGILGCLQYIGKRIPEDPKSKRMLKAAQESAERGAALTKRLLAFARRQELHPEAIHLGALVDGLTEMLRRSVGPTITIDLDIAEDLDLIEVDPNQLELALLNLTLNARDAMPEGGRITIAAHNADMSNAMVALQQGRYVEVSVIDDGAGMDEATLKRCTEPFYTTKERGKGTGLGLSTVQGMAVQSGGAIHISSTPGAGTKVDLWFPVAAAASAIMAAAPAVDAAPADNQFMVLVVDDEALVGHVTATMVEDLGHAAMWVPSGAEALEVIRSGRPIDVVITDHAMPGMTGGQLAEVIHKLIPGMPIILATGFADLPGSYAQDLPRLSKPYGPDELAQALAMVEPQQRAAS